MDTTFKEELPEYEEFEAHIDGIDSVSYFHISINILNSA